ncbi:MAG: efflux RND transporter periplasmic adaptor subunit [Longimicrobiales bacterium]
MNAKITRWGGTALAILALTACKDSQAADTPRLTTAEVTRGDLVIRAEATGTVEPVRSVEVKSKASGEILKLYVDVGDAVEPGALLVAVDPRDVRNKYDQAQADLEVAKTRTEISKSQLNRSQELLTAGVITEQEHESKRLEYANAVANQVKAETNFELAELQLSDVTIRAPMRGTIIQKSVEEGQVIQSASGNVSGGTTLFIMANLDEMQVRTLVDETDMGDIRAGLSTIVTVEAFPDRTFRGDVEKIEPQATVQQNVTMFPVIVTLDNRAGLLKPGMNAEVEILVDQATDVLLVPNSAIVRPADVGPAALALGLDVESMDLTQFMRAGRTGGRTGEAAAAQGGAAAQPGAASPAAQSAAAQSSRAQGGSPQGAPAANDPQAAARRARVDSLRARVERGEITQDSMRVLMQALRPQGAGAPAGSMTSGGGAGGGAQAATTGTASARETRASVVFVLRADSVPEPRLIQVGLNDWDNTEVVSGLEGTETLVVVSAAQLQARQAEWLNQIRSRMGGSPFGGGGGPGMGGGGGRPPGRD